MEGREEYECRRMEKRRVQRGEEDNGIVIPRHIRSLSGLMSRYIRNHYTCISELHFRKSATISY